MILLAVDVSTVLFESLAFGFWPAAFLFPLLFPLFPFLFPLLCFFTCLPFGFRLAFRVWLVFELLLLLPFTCALLFALALALLLHVGFSDNSLLSESLLRAMAERDGPVTESKLWCGVPLVDIRVIPV